VDYSSIASTFQDIAKAGTTFVYVLGVAVGIAFVLAAIVSIIKKGGRNAHHEITWGSIAGKALVGSLLTTMGFVLGNILSSMGTASEAVSALAYVQNSNSDCYGSGYMGSL